MCQICGGSAPQVRAKAARAYEEQQALAAAARMAGRLDLSQFTDPVKALEFAVGYSHALATQLAVIVHQIPDDELVSRAGELAAAQRALADLRAAAESLRMGLAERQVGIRERTADMLQRALDTALQTAGVPLEKQHVARDTFRRNMVLLRPEPEEEPRAITQNEYVDAEIWGLERRKEAALRRQVPYRLTYEERIRAIDVLD